MASESEDRQISTFLYCVLTSTNISNNDRKQYDKVLAKMDEFKVQKNVIFVRARFNQRTQRDGETAEEYITCLYSLAADCQYRNLKDEIRRVAGIRNNSLSVHLQMDPNLMLEKAKQIVRQRETVQKQQTILNHWERLAETTVSYLKTDKRSSSHRTKTSTAQQKPQQQQHSQKCTRCEKGPHPCGACPTKEAICHKCKKKDVQCFSKGLAEVTMQRSY